MALDLDDDVSRSRILTHVLTVGLFLVPVSAGVLWVLHGPTWVETGGLVLLAAACLGATALLQRGQVSAAAWLVVSVAAFDVVAIAYTQGGAASPATAGSLVIVALASMFLGTRGAIAFTTMAVLMGVGFEVLDRAGWLPPPLPVSHTAWALSLVIDPIPVGVMIASAGRQTQRALEAARETTRRLRESVAAVSEGRLLLERQARQQAAVAYLGRVALVTVDLDGLLRHACQEAANALDADVVAIWLVDGGLLRARATNLPDGRIPDLELEDYVARATDHGAKPLVVPDLEHDANFSGHVLQGVGLRRAVFAGISAGDERFGVIAALHIGGGAYAYDDVNFLDGVAGVIAAALARARTEDALRTSESRLLQAAKMDAIGRLAGGVAHDFNNLMTGVLAYSDLILGRSDIDEALRDDVNEIQRAANRAGDLTRQLLAFSRQQVLRPRRVLVNNVIGDLEKMLQRMIGEDIELATLFKDDLPMVEVDTVQLQQVLLNLVVNARDALPRGGRLEIETNLVTLGPEDPQLQMGSYVQILIRDNGPGIAPDQLPFVFEPFFTTKDDSSGLGLATVYGIVAQSGGDVRVSSRLGLTEFRILLPAAGPGEDAAMPIAGDPGGAGRQRVLVVDDDIVLLRAVSRVLKGAGHDVIAISTASAAIRAFDASIDVVITDVVMPGMSGPELITRLRERGTTARFILMSGYVGDALDRHTPLGTDIAFISKPFPASVLREMVDRVGRRHSISEVS